MHLGLHASTKLFIGSVKVLVAGGMTGGITGADIAREIQPTAAQSASASFCWGAA